MDVFVLRNQVIEDYSQYVRSFITIRDPRVSAVVERELRGGALWPEPLLQLNPAFEPGESLEDLVASGALHPECRRIFRRKPRPDADDGPLRLHRHQVESIHAARAGENYVLTTGTGSGKSLSYIVPIVDHVLRQGSGRGIQAIVVYPMNALANSQVGELKKFLEHGYPENAPPVTFQRYTGQERGEDRDRIISNPPDILLTNYVMLELLLTRPREVDLVRAARGLRFLVLDELHTYRGRQGADVAMLVRRVREACQSTNTIHVGTSATLRPNEGTWREARVEVARVASRLFGAAVRPERVIGETLRRTTALYESNDRETLRARLLREEVDWPDVEAFRRDPLSAWIESTLGLREEEGRLVRTRPRPLRGNEGVVEALARDTGVDERHCEAALRSALLAGYRLRDADGRPAFAFRLHQFVSKGESVYATLEPEGTRHVTLQAQQFAPESERSKVLLPLAFCRECGQEYYVVRRQEEAGTITYVPRELSDRRHDPEGGEAGFLYLSSADPWPATGSPAMLERLPESWVDIDDDRRVLKSSRRERVPHDITISTLGVEGEGDQRAHWIRAPFLLCLHCLVDYDAHQRSDFGKLATLGSEGRSSATTVLSLSTLRQLRLVDLPDEARKLLSFTDNRQDASLQAGHFNDFVEVCLIRAALWRAASRTGPDGLRHDELTQRVFDALDLPLSLYAQNPEVRYRAAEETRRALRQVLGHYLYRDLRRGWRVTSPNLEQSGLLRIDYLCLDDLARDDAEWRGLHPVLAAATPAERALVCRTLLDYLRRELVIRVDALEPEQHERIKSLSDQYLEEPWAVDRDDNLERGRIAFPPTETDRRAPTSMAVYVSERGGFGLFLRRPTTFASAAATLSMDDTRTIIGQLLENLIKPDILARVRLGRRPSDPTGYQINAAAIVWRTGDGRQAFHDPVRVPNPPRDGLRTNPFFVELYRSDTARVNDLRGREHTAQVPAEERERREELFRGADLPVLFCSPTMELGVDIAQLNVVNMRNVPPTPANYAQRSGRAGRSGQPAFVYTYCSSGSPHDQYFFRRPERMVSGAVTPPRLDLANEDLLRAHVHAVWASEVRLDLKSSLADVLDVSTDTPTLAVLPEIRELLHSRTPRENALRRCREALGPAVQELLESAAAEGTDVDDWLRQVLERLPASFEEACERWRGLYRSAIAQAKRQQRILLDPSRDSGDRDRAKRLEAEAIAQLDLLLDRQGTEQSDFYSYRYFASEGFLPGYNFPRLPLSAYLPARRRVKGLPNFLSRPRFLAITEFGPKSFLYHEGSRYQIMRVILPVNEGTDGEARTITSKGVLCVACGYLHPVGDAPPPDLCELCRATLPLPWKNLFRMQNVSTRRRERINSDEEERLRLGYEVRTGVRFAERDGFVHVRTAQLRGADGELLAKLHYGHAATIWRMNLGERRRKKRERRGYVLDLERGWWVPDADEEEPDERSEVARSEEQPSKRVERVIPYVEDRRNCLLLEPTDPLPIEVMASLQAALKGALQVYFQLEDNELATEPLPDDTSRRQILMYEASEGGAGALRRLVDPREHRTLPEIARLALELCHYDPETLEDRGQADGARERCEAACYDCLLSYYNQRDHRVLDRAKVKEVLDAWRQGDVVLDARQRPAVPPPAPDAPPPPAPAAAGPLGRWLDALQRLGLRRPERTEATLEGVAVDAYYPGAATAVVVGRALDPDDVTTLEDAGIGVVSFGPDDRDWPGVFGRYPGVFGTPRPGGSRPPAPPPSPEPPGLDLDLFDAAWHPLLRALAATPAVTVDAGGDVSRGGRVVGSTAAVVLRGSGRLHLVDDRDPAAADVLAALTSQGAAVLRLRPDAPDGAGAVLAALDGGRA
ncbi:MAG: DEAD/DEAH box helicase [Planctomycetes bacterium]|nr:DEAD/DEAH box helicase [Planctomycetota bacterium]